MKVPVPNQTEVRGILQVSYISHRYLNMGLEVERKKKSRNGDTETNSKSLAFCSIINGEYVEQKSGPF